MPHSWKGLIMTRVIWFGEIIFYKNGDYFIYVTAIRTINFTISFLRGYDGMELLNLTLFRFSLFSILVCFFYDSTQHFYVLNNLHIIQFSLRFWLLIYIPDFIAYLLLRYSRVNLWVKLWSICILVYNFFSFSTSQ